jgi:type III secretory pathway component EscT
MASNPLLDLATAGELDSLLVGWFLWAPTAVLVPAVGWVGSPIGLRLAIGLGLSLCVLPEAPVAGPLWIELGRALGIGVSVAVGAALVLWAALMVGGVADRAAFRSGRSDAAEPGPLPAGPLALLFGLLTCLAFLAGGGPQRVGDALVTVHRARLESLVEPVVSACIAAIHLAVAVATPVLLTLVLLEALAALLQRTAAPLLVEAALGPLKALAFLFLLAVALEPLVSALARALG